VWQWHSDWVLAHQDIQETPVATSISTPDIVASIKDGHLFGIAAAKLGDMPITNLQLRVTGIVKKVDAEGVSTSKAYISIDGQPGKVYQSGESLPYGVKVYEITPNAVVLENNGHLEKLPLPREHLKFKSRIEERSP
jgi:type II secretory pathway component PulC